MICIYCLEKMDESNTQIGAGDGNGQKFAHKVCWDLMQLGINCANWIAGPIEDHGPRTLNEAWNAIKYKLDAAEIAHNKMTELKNLVDIYFRSAYK